MTHSTETYFVFSDESGNYEHKEMRGNKFLRRNPYYVRSTLVLKASDWQKLKNAVKVNKSNLGFSEKQEIKCSEIYQAIRKKTYDQEIREKDREFYLKDIETEKLKTYVKNTLSILNILKQPQISLSLTINEKITGHSRDVITFWHIQDLIERAQTCMIERDGNNLAVIFIDELAENRENHNVQNKFSEMVKHGDFVNKFDCVKDNLNMEISSHSPGMQVADFIAGIWYGALRGDEEALELFK